MRLDWKNLEPEGVEFWCKMSDHQTVGENCYCRCGEVQYEPWNTPVTDARIFSSLPEYEPDFAPTGGRWERDPVTRIRKWIPDV